MHTYLQIENTNRYSVLYISPDIGRIELESGLSKEDAQKLVNYLNGGNAIDFSKLLNEDGEINVYIANESTSVYLTNDNFERTTHY